jgi:hypothetical protein
LREITSLDDILSFTTTLSFLFYFFGGSVKSFAVSADLISLHLVALLCGEDCFPLACLDEAFAMSIGIPPLDNAIILYLHRGLSQAL